jgi:hypothetical protein
MVAAMLSLPEMVKLLLAAGADVRARDLVGETALSLVEQLQKEYKSGVRDEVIRLLKNAIRGTTKRKRSTRQGFN